VRRLRPQAEIDDFDAAYHIRENPDIAASGIDPLCHYLNYEREEGMPQILLK
jgi:hypothetical protein